MEINTLEMRKTEIEQRENLKRIMVLRALFVVMLFSSSVYFQINSRLSPGDFPIIVLHLFSAAAISLCLCYALLFRLIRRVRFFSFFQISVDTILVSMIIYITGSFSSVFTYLYPVVIIYASILIGSRGGLIVASMCGIEYGLMIDLEYFGVLDTFSITGVPLIQAYEWKHVVYKIINTLFVCYAVSFLSGLLVKQNAESKRRLAEMESQVKRVEKMAAIGELASGLAHEIKNPIASMTGSIQILREDLVFEGEDERLMDIVMREADRLNVLVTDFLLYARPHSGSPSAVNVCLSAREVVGLVSKNLDKNIIFEVHSGGLKEIWVWVDAGHLKQVIWNVVLNAVEAIEKEGRVDISVGLRPNGKVRVEISDSGIGIPEQIQGSVTNPFFTTKKRGTGLGLSIVYSILKRYDCSLDFDSKLGEGSIFHFELNMAEAPTNP